MDIPRIKLLQYTPNGTITLLKSTKKMHTKANRGLFYPFIRLSSVFRLDALALSVIATATWLAGWLDGWLSHSGIVSKRLNLSENFFHHLKAPSL